MVSKTSQFLVPVNNGNECTDEFLRRSLAVLSRAADLKMTEIFFTDWPGDDTLDKLAADPRRCSLIRVVIRLRNFDYQTPVTADPRIARADFVCAIDADLQQPAQLSLDMHAEMRRRKLNFLYAERSQCQGDGIVKQAFIRNAISDFQPVDFRCRHWGNMIQYSGYLEVFRLVNGIPNQ